MVAEKTDNQKSLIIFAIVALMFLFACSGLLITAVYTDRQSGRYPGAEVIASHNNYSGLPFQFSWDDTYSIEANFLTVYRWYSARFDLGAESAANGTCIYSESTKQGLIASRRVGLIMCGNPDGTMVFLNRTTSLRR